MSETTKKAKAPAKSKTTTKTATTKTATKANSIHQVEKATITHDQIEQLARKYWAERGWKDGYAEQDWLRAESELRQKAS